MRFTTAEDAEMLCACLREALLYFGGVPQHVLFDNAKTIVIERDAHGDGQHRWHAKLLAVAEEFGFQPRLCRPYRAKTKGKVERFNGYLKGSFLVPLAATLKSAGLKLDAVAANVHIGRWLAEVANACVHATTKERPDRRLARQRSPAISSAFHLLNSYMTAERADDRIDIADTMNRYIRGVDRCNWPLVRSAYHTDAFDDRGMYQGDVDGFIAHLVRRHQHVEQSMHVIGNMVYEFIDADSALVETYFVTYQRIGPGAGDSLLPFMRGLPLPAGQAVETEIVGRYIDHFTRRSLAWRIQRRLVIAEVLRGAAAHVGGGLSAPWTLARRDGNDPLERMRAELGLPSQ